MRSLTNHAQVRLQFDLEPLEGALQLLDLCAGRRQSLRLRPHVLFHRCDLNVPEEGKLRRKRTDVGGWQGAAAAPPSPHLGLVPGLQLLAVLCDDAFVVLPDL